MAGHRLWGKPLTVAIYRPGNKWPLAIRDKPKYGEEPVDLDKKFAITSPDGGWTWGRNLAGKVAKMQAKEKNPRKRQVSCEPPYPRKRARMISPRKGPSSNRPIGKDQMKAYSDPSPVQSPLVVPGTSHEQHLVNGLFQDPYNGQKFLVRNSLWIPINEGICTVIVDGTILELGSCF